MVVQTRSSILQVEEEKMSLNSQCFFNTVSKVAFETSGKEQEETRIAIILERYVCIDTRVFTWQMKEHLPD